MMRMTRIDDEDSQDDEDSKDDEDSQDDDDSQDDEDSEDDYDYGPFNSVIFSQRMKKLTEDETINVIAMLPSSVHYLGRPFVHCLTKTNIVKHIMKLPMKMFSDLDIPAIGRAGVRLGAAGPVTTVQYKTETDRRISFYEAGWREFVTGKRRLRVDSDNHDKEQQLQRLADDGCR